MKRIVCALLLLCLCLSLTGCGASSSSSGEPTRLAFSDAVSVDTIRSLDGKRVTINGYMATLSPISGRYAYLMNMPYQSCPFCVPNTTQLSNTIAVYAPEGKSFSFTDSAVCVTGTLRVEDYTDEYGYSYSYRIADATLSTVDLSTVSEAYALWQTIAEDGVVGDINAMLDYLHFVCCWPEYSMNAAAEDGSTVQVSLYPGDAKNILQDNGPYGYASYRREGYFADLADQVKDISATELTDLIAVIDAAKEVEALAISELEAGSYTYSEAEDRYYLTNADMLYERWYAVYVSFSQWLAKWQF